MQLNGSHYYLPVLSWPFFFFSYLFVTMVVFIDLGDDVEPPELSSLKTNALSGWYQTDRIPAAPNTQTPKKSLGKLNERMNPNKNAVTEALGCYPSVLPVHSSGFMYLH